jgi:hypothetical protein
MLDISTVLITPRCNSLSFSLIKKSQKYSRERILKVAPSLIISSLVE